MVATKNAIKKTVKTESQPNRRRFLIVFLFVGALLFVVLSAILSIGVYAVLVADENWSEDDFWSEDCNVLVLPLRGYLSTYRPAGFSDEDWDIASAEELTEAIADAQEARFKAVLLSIDSSGGDPVAGQEVANALRASGLPSVAVIRGLGASAAYWAATGADRLYASRVSEVGGIGVTASYLDESDKNKQEGYAYTELTSAKYKDLGDPGRPLSADERKLILADLEKMHRVFIEEVALNRGLALEVAEELANGLTYLGEDALASGLIDELGGAPEALQYLETRLGEPVRGCRN